MSTEKLNSTRILHIVGSPKADDSSSTRMAQAFLAGAQQANPGHQITTLDVWAEDLPYFGRELALAKMIPLTGGTLSESQQAGWKEVVRVITELDQHDKIVISTPMWNFSIPHQLKHYFDIVVQPGLTFGVNAAGEHIGLLKDRPVQLLLSRSSPFPERSPEDYQLPYLKHVLSFMGLKSIDTLILEGTTLPHAEREKLINEYCAMARIAGADF